MDPTEEELPEARRQIDSVIHKLKESMKSMEPRDNTARLKAQMGLSAFISRKDKINKSQKPSVF